MNRCFLMLVLFYLGNTASLLAADNRPNILFYFVDDWGRHASSYADPDQPSLDDVIRTPNFDRVAREGVRFNNAFVPVSSCGPCRASLATGRYFWTCGSGAVLAERLRTVMEETKDPRLSDEFDRLPYVATIGPTQTD